MVSPVDDATGGRKRAIRARNRALLVMLLAVAVLFYIVTIMRMGG